MGIFIVFEGGEGVGKTTQARALFRRLVNRHYDVILTYEPGGTCLGKVLRPQIMGRSDITPMAELFLLAASRAQLVKEVIAPALSREQIVICDRYTASTVAYQGYGRGLQLELIEQVNRAATGGLEADLTILLTIAPEAGLARKKDDIKDTFEAQATDFHDRVQQGYKTLAAAYHESWVVLDGSLPVREVSTQVWQKVQPFL